MKYVLALVLLVVSVHFLHAQDMQEDENRRQPGFGETDYVKVYGGVTLSELKVGNSDYDNSAEPGFDFGFAYERGGLFYYGAGVRYNMGLYELTSVNNSESDYFKIHSIDIPLVGGVNFLNHISRFVGLRLFVGITPAFIVGVGENDFSLDMQSSNIFQVNGQAGLGFDVAFIFVEASFNRGFTDVFEEFDSSVSQIVINFGLRF